MHVRVFWCQNMLLQAQFACVYVCVTANLHVRAAHYKQNSGVHKVLKSQGLKRRLWLQLSPWQRQLEECLCWRAPFIVSRFQCIHQL